MIRAKNRTPAASGCGCDRTTFTQTENRQRRREGKITVNTGEFSTVSEIGESAEALAHRIAALKSPLRLRGLVLDYADAAHEFVSTTTGWVAERDALARTTHLLDEPGKRRTAVTMLVDMAPRPALPEVTNEMVIDGSWAAALTQMSEPVDGPLAELLAKAYAPGAPELRGQPSRSDRLNRLLLDTIDRAAMALDRGLDRAKSTSPTPTPTTTDQRAELAALGVQI